MIEEVVFVILHICVHVTREELQALMNGNQPTFI